MSGSPGLLPEAPAAPAPLRLLGAAVDWTVVAMGAAIVAVVFANVVLHQLALDIAWTTEFGELVMVWTTFLGAAAAVRRGAHMAVTELAQLLPRGPRRVLDAAIQLLVAWVLLLLVWKGWIAVQASWDNVLTVLDWPMAVQYLSLPVGSAIALVFVLWNLVLIARGR
ncbi:MAG TPA: TRAP transporter small permease subunit [Burkholderiales bacterium]|nr:TRAP transporter small permease subunit [Burkholderiales bacterium]